MAARPLSVPQTLQEKEGCENATPNISGLRVGETARMAPGIFSPDDFDCVFTRRSFETSPLKTSVNTSDHSSLATRHLSLIQSARTDFLLLATGIEKLAEPDYQRIQGDSKGGESGSDSLRRFEAARQLSRRKLLLSALKRLRIANAAFLKAAGALAGISDGTAGKSPDALSARPSAVYQSLIPKLKLEPRHARALASLEALEIFLSPRKSKNPVAPAPSLPPKSFLYRFESATDPSRRAGRKIAAVALDLKSPGDVDLGLVARVFDTARICASHVAARLPKGGKS